METSNLSSTITVRDATIADLPAIRDIYNHAVLHSTCTADYEPRTEAAQLEWFEARKRGDYPVFVAESEGGVVGWSSLGPYHSRVGYRFTGENSVYLLPDAQGKGIGQLLLAPLIDKARERGLRAIIASIDGGNQASLKLHKRFGFVEVGRFPGIITKFDRWLDVVYLQLSLV